MSEKTAAVNALLSFCRRNDPMRTFQTILLEPLSASKRRSRRFGTQSEARRKRRVRVQPTEAGYSEDFGSGGTERAVAGVRAYRWSDRKGHFETVVRLNNAEEQRRNGGC